jgi:hypothetical protein
MIGFPESTVIPISPVEEAVAELVAVRAME